MFELGNAVCYQGYREGQSPIEGIYPTKKQVLEDLQLLEKDFDYIRVYDTSKHTIDILETIKNNKISIRVMLSMYLFAEKNHNNHPVFGMIDEKILRNNINKNNNLCEEVVALAKKYNDIIFSISVGNEARSIWNVNRVSDKRIAKLVKMVQEKVAHPVTFCEEWKYWITDLPQTASVVDFISIHSYPVWNGTDLDGSINELNNHYQTIKSMYPNKKIIITETGWPTKTDNKKIPFAWANTENQYDFLQRLSKWSIKHDTIVFIFEAFDELWKGAENLSDPEKNWGVYDENRIKKYE